MFEEFRVMSAKKFSYQIEEYVNKTGSSYLDAILEYCSDNNLEPESVASLITKPLKEKIEVEAMKLNLIPKVSQLPL